MHVVVLVLVLSCLVMFLPGRCRAENTNTGHKLRKQDGYISTCILHAIVCIRGMFYSWYVYSAEYVRGQSGSMALWYARV